MVKIDSMPTTTLALESQIDKFRSAQATVGIIGLGYVGLPLALLFAEAGIRVIGFDIDKSKVDSINSGCCYIKHLKQPQMKTFVQEERLKATCDYAYAASCDAVIICVPTPLGKHLEPDLMYITDTCRAIAPHLRPQTLVCLESTTWPGTTEEIVAPLLGDEIFLCFSPEREDPGNKNYTTKSIPKLIGGINKESLDLGVALYSLAVDNVIPLSNPRVAETAKLFENIFRCVNIALVNEMKVICDAMNLDIWEIIDAADTKPFGFMKFLPGPGLGGHCIPIDPFYLTWKAKEFGIPTRFIELAGEINRAMPNYVVGKVQDALNDVSKPLRGARILLFGLAYKSDIDDMRESPSLTLIDMLEAKGAIVDYYDPYFSEIGITRSHPRLTGRISKEPTDQYDCFIISTVHDSFSKQEILSYGVPIVDTRNFIGKHDLVTRA